MEPGAAQLRERLSACLRDRDRAGAVTTSLDAVGAGQVTIPELYDELAGLLVDVGSRWHRGELEVWQEHLSTSVVRTIVEACAPLVADAALAPIGRTVVLATPPDEQHDVGLRMLADRFQLSGWTAHHLGASVPVEQLSAAVTELGADAVALSASTHFHRVALRRYLDELRRTHPDLRAWVGGAAFARSSDGWEDATVLDPAAIPAISVALRP